MTILEKWKLDYNCSCEDVIYESCPSSYYPHIEDISTCTRSYTPCGECWRQEFREEKPVTDGCFAEDGYSPKLEPSIKDSGDRTEFETGAVRDMREGKGRCDLMPLDVVANWFKQSTTIDPYPERTDMTYWVLTNIYRFQETGKCEFLYHALNAFAGVFDYAPSMFLEAAIHFEEGAKKYGENNWQKGIPVYCYIDSAVRHYLKFLRGDKDEPHDRAVIWNLMCAIWTCEHMPELNGYAKEE